MHLLVLAAFTLSALLCVATAALAWERCRSAPAGRWLRAMLLAAALWSSTEVAQLLAPTPEAVWFLQVGLHVLADVAVVSLWGLCRSVADPHWRLSRSTAGTLCAPLLAVLLVVVTNPWHGWFLTQVTSTRAGWATVVTTTPGPLYALQLGLPLALVVLTMTTAVQTAATAPPVLRRQLLHVVVAAALPLVTNLASAVHPGSVDVTATTFTVSALLLARALRAPGLLRLVPVARARVLETLDDAVVVVATSGQVVDLNHAAERLLVRSHPDLDPAAFVGGQAPGFLADAVQAQLEGASRHRTTLGTGVHVDARVTPLGAGGRSHGFVVVLRDISELVEQQRALEMANGRLQEQLAVIDALRGQLAHDAVRDPLTGVHNRVHLDRTLDVTLALAAADDRPVTVLALDLGDVARVGDRHGFDTADEVLRLVARDLVLSSRDADVVARTDGHRFVLVLPGMDAATADRRAQALRDRCTTLRLRGSDRPLGLSTSVAATTFPDDGRSGLQLLSALDRALARARFEGRPQVAPAP